MGLTIFEHMQKHVTDWINLLIPSKVRDPMATCIKLQEEVSELTYAQYTGNKAGVGEELADCFILLVDIAYLNNIDLSAEFYAKMDVNKARKWKTKNGSMKHEDN